VYHTSIYTPHYSLTTQIPSSTFFLLLLNFLPYPLVVRVGEGIRNDYVSPLALPQLSLCSLYFFLYFFFFGFFQLLFYFKNS
jgi:hypothetical protein